MKLFHTSGCECDRCCKPKVNPSAERITSPGSREFTANVQRREPQHSEDVSGRLNARLYTQPAFREFPDAPRSSDVWHIGKDGCHAASYSWVALTATPDEYHAVMRDDFIDPLRAPALTSGLKRGGESGLFVDRVNIESYPSMAAGDMVTLTAMGRRVRG